jgi:penicillin-binding protein 1A
MTPDGAVRALVGGTRYADSQFNRATQALRQPGSAFKPIVYLAAFEAGFTPDSVMFDGPISIDGWQPANYDGKYYGDVTLREAMARSLNSVAAQLVGRVGAAQVVEVARRLGIASAMTATPSIALGTSEVTLLELTGAYATFVNYGLVVLPRGIERVSDSEGNVIYERIGEGAGAIVARGSPMQDVLAAVIGWSTGAPPCRPLKAAGSAPPTLSRCVVRRFATELVTGVWLGATTTRR